jgi:hypothetical protein
MSSTVQISIIATAFEETFIGKTFAGSKMRTRFSMLLNWNKKLTVEIVNSRLSRKKSILMNGEVVTQFHKTTTEGLHYSWNYPVAGSEIEFRLEPNTGGTGTDLKVNGKDFFDYVYAIDDDGPDAIRNLTKGSNTSMTFKIPPRVQSSGSAIDSKPISREPENALPKLYVFDGSPKVTDPPAKPRRESKVSTVQPANLIAFPTGLKKGNASASYTKFQDSEEETPVETRNDLI